MRIVMFKLIPGDDPDRARRLYRLFMSFGFYAPCTLLVWYSFTKGWFAASPSVLLTAAGILTAVYLLLYLLIRFGISLRFRDPGLTAPQMGLILLTLMFLMYYTREVRGSMLLFFTVLSVIGVFLLKPGRNLTMTVLLPFCLALSSAMLLKFHPDEISFEKELFHVLILTAVMPWFSMLGDRFHHLRRQVDDAGAKLGEARMTIEHLGAHDDLTRIYNRRRIMELIDWEKMRADRSYPGFCIALVDLDHFKDINESYGHRVGDQVIASIARTLQSEIREPDAMGRYGGEEFIVLLGHSDIETAEMAAQRLRTVVESLAHSALAHNHRVTISIGLVEYRPVEELDELLSRAETALYQAKVEGRNRVVRGMNQAAPKMH